jgi:hypothetical protein
MAGLLLGIGVGAVLVGFAALVEATRCRRRGYRHRDLLPGHGSQMASCTS